MPDYLEPTSLVPAQHVSSTAGEIYAGHATRKTLITAISVTEQAGAAQNLDIWLVPDGGSRGIDNRIINTLPFVANETAKGTDASNAISALVGKILLAGTDIHAQASASSTALTIEISGRIFEDPS